jgi:hypothetical protein
MLETVLVAALLATVNIRRSIENFFPDLALIN